MHCWSETEGANLCVTGWCTIPFVLCLQFLDISKSITQKEASTPFNLVTPNSLSST